MPSQWFYSRQGAKFGPVTTDQLKALAASAQIATTDLVWKEGMAEWVAASGLKGLFPAAPVASTPQPPSLPTEPPNAPPVAAPTIGSRLKSAGKLAAAQANRTKLVTISLPHAYRELGRHVQHSGQFRDEFSDLYRQFDDLTASMSSITSNAAARPAAEGFAGKAKATAIAAKEMAQSKGAELRIAQIMGRLGEAAFEKHSEQSGPAAVVNPIVQTLAQVAALDVEIAALNVSKPGQWVTPKRLAIAGVLGIILIGLAMVGKVLSTGEQSAPTLNDTTGSNAAGDKPADGGDPATGRQLQVRVNTAGEKLSFQNLYCNPALKNVRCFAAEGQLVISFDIASQTSPSIYHPLMVRLFDENGSYLTHFTTEEIFTNMPHVQGAALKSKGNRLVYKVNVRDLRDAAIAEVGFAPNPNNFNQ